MIAALLMLADAPLTAVDAERAFAAAARSEGQWTAFRRFAAEGATMFVPQPVDAQAFLAARKDPAKSIAWSPAASYVSCDGTAAANTGPWQRPDGSVGYFSTIWQRQPEGGWKWLVDGGDGLETPRPAVAEPVVERASCIRAPIPNPAPLLAGMKGGGGTSRDRSLWWTWRVAGDGARTFTVRLWTGEEYRTVIDDRIAAPAAE